jgi:hypothetical protein
MTQEERDDMLIDMSGKVGKIHAALYDDHDNKQKGLITQFHELKPQVETFGRYLNARQDLTKTYWAIFKWVGGIITIAGTVVTIIVSIR